METISHFRQGDSCHGILQVVRSSRSPQVRRTQVLFTRYSQSSRSDATHARILCQTRSHCMTLPPSRSRLSRLSPSYRDVHPFYFTRPGVFRQSELQSHIPDCQGSVNKSKLCALYIKAQFRITAAGNVISSPSFMLPCTYSESTRCTYVKFNSRTFHLPQRVDSTSAE
jgi:hypothetical protein